MFLNLTYIRAQSTLCTVWQQINYYESTQKMYTSIICGQFIVFFFCFIVYIFFVVVSEFFRLILLMRIIIRSIKKERVDVDDTHTKNASSYMILIIEEFDTINSLLGLPAFTSHSYELARTWAIRTSIQYISRYSRKWSSQQNGNQIKIVSAAFRWMDHNHCAKHRMDGPCILASLTDSFIYRRRIDNERTKRQFRFCVRNIPKRVRAKITASNFMTWIIVLNQFLLFIRVFLTKPDKQNDDQMLGIREWIFYGPKSRIGKKAVSRKKKREQRFVNVWDNHQKRGECRQNTAK